MATRLLDFGGSDSGSRRSSSRRSSSSRRLLDFGDNDSSGSNKQESGSGGGFLGAIGKVIDKSGLDTVLDVIDTPRAITASWLNEALDVIQGRGFSPRDLVSNARSNIGWSEILGQGTPNTRVRGASGESVIGNRGARAGLGLALDIGLDPITYLSFGTGSVATKGGTAAAKASAKQIGRRVVERKAAGELSEEVANDLIARVGRRSAAGLSEKELADLGFRGGIRARAPGTGRVGRIAGKAVGADVRPIERELISHDTLRKLTGPIREAGRAVDDTALGKVLGRLGGNESKVALERVFRSGDASKAADALQALSAKARSEVRAGGMAAKWQRELEPLLKPIAKRKMGTELIDALEGNADAAARLRSAGLDHDPVRAWFDRVRSEANDALGHEWLSSLDNYVRHVRSGEARKLSKGGAQRAKGGVPKAAMALERQYRAGSQFLGRTLETGSIEEINRTAREVLGADAVKLFEDDPVKVLTAYADGVGRALSFKLTEQALREVGIVTARGVRHSAGDAVTADAGDLLSEAQIGTKQRLSAVSDGITLGNGSEALETAPGGAISEEVARRIDRAVGTLPKGAELGDMEALVDGASAVVRSSDDVGEQLRAVDDVAERARAASGVTPEQSEKFWTEQASKKLATPEGHQAVLDQHVQAMRAWGEAEQAPEWLAHALLDLGKAGDYIEYSKMLKRWDQFHRWVRAWLLAKPSYALNNFWGAYFQNWVHGVEGIKPYREFVAGWRNPGTNRWVDEVRASGIAEGGQFASETQRAVARTPLGNVNPFNTGNAWIRVNRGASEKVETLVRGTLAYHVLSGGGSIDDAIEAVSARHFRYDDLSRIERYGLKRVTAFYTYTARVIPVAIETLFLHPDKIQRYTRAMAAIETLTTPEDVVPSYFGEQGAVRMPFGLGPGQAYWMPRLPFQSADEAMPLEGNPIRALGSQLTPAIKAPWEAYERGRQFYSDVPLSDEQRPIPRPLSFVAPFLAAVGVAKKTDDGWQMREKDLYVVDQYLPVLGQARRLVPSEPKQQERVLASWVNFLFGTSGSFVVNTPRAQKSELIRRQYASSGR